MIPLRMKLAVRSVVVVDEKAIVMKSNIRLKPLTISRNSQASGRTVHSASTTHSQTQIIRPHRSTYHRLKSRNATGPTK